MPTINQLTRTSELEAGDLFPIFSTDNGDARAVALSVLLAYILENITEASPGFVDYTTQYAAPSATGFNVAINAGSAALDPPTNGQNVHLILTPTAGFAAGTITLPPVAECVDKQEVLVNSTQQVTALTVAANGATAVTGEPASLGADDFFRLKFDAATSTWYRVG